MSEETGENGLEFTAYVQKLYRVAIPEHIRKLFDVHEGDYIVLRFVRKVKKPSRK